MINFANDTYRLEGYIVIARLDKGEWIEAEFEKGTVAVEIHNQGTQTVNYAYKDGQDNPPEIARDDHLVISAMNLGVVAYTPESLYFKRTASTSSPNVICSCLKLVKGDKIKDK